MVSNSNRVVDMMTAVITTGLSIWSFWSAVHSYTLLTQMQSASIIDHWNALPLIGVDIISKNESCESVSMLSPIWSPNDPNALQTIGRFPGSLPWCECGRGYEFAYNHTTSMCACGESNDSSFWEDGPCSQQQHAMGCNTKQKEMMIYESWTTQKGECPLNATTAGCADDIPLKSKNLEIWKNGKKICYQRGGWTTIQRMEDLKANGGCKQGVTCQSAERGDNPIHTICAPKHEECPIVHLGDLDMATDLETSTGGVFGGKALPIIEIQTTIGSPCWRGKWGQFGRSNNERVADKYDTECKVDDTRFEEWDTMRESELYQINQVGTSGNVLMAADGKSIYSNTRSAVQYYDRNEDVFWKISYRRDIEWNSDCAAGDIHHWVDKVNLLRHVIGYEMICFVVNGFFGLFIMGIAIPCAMCKRTCDQDRGSRDDLDKSQKAMICVSAMAKMMPLVLCLVVTDSVHSFFNRAGSSQCSDGLTNGSMIDLAAEMQRVERSNWMTMYVDIAIIVVLLISSLCHRIEKEEADSKEELSCRLQEHGDIEMQAIISTEDEELKVLTEPQMTWCAVPLELDRT